MKFVLQDISNSQFSTSVFVKLSRNEFPLMRNFIIIRLLY